MSFQYAILHNIDNVVLKKYIKAKPVEKQGRKATDLTLFGDRRVRSCYFN